MNHQPSHVATTKLTPIQYILILRTTTTETTKGEKKKKEKRKHKLQIKAENHIVPPSMCMNILENLTDIEIIKKLFNNVIVPEVSISRAPARSNTQS